MNASQGSARQASGEAQDVTDVVRLADTRGPIRLGFWVLVVGFGALLAWAAWAPLDEGVSATGVVSVESRRKPIQHFNGGVIKELRVQDAQMVKAGEVLVVLDDASIKAGRETLQQGYWSQRATESRLLAELAGADRIDFHPDLKTSEGEARPHLQAQQQLFDARRSAHRAEMAAGEEVIAGLQAQLSGLKGVLEGRQAQARAQAEQLASVRGLAGEGFAPRNQVLQMEQSQAEVRASLADVQANIQRATNAMAETRLRLAQRRQEYLKEVAAQLSEVRREVQANQEKLVAVTAEWARTRIVAPMDGQVVGLQLAGVGGVVSPGQRLMDVVPQGETLLLDVKVPVHVIDRVRVGDVTEVRFSGFANSPQLVVEGRIQTLAGDVVSEQIGPQVVSYYAARVELTPEGLKALGHRQLQPGMPAEVLIRTGERSLLTYLLHPLTKRIAAAMKEE